MFCTKCGHRTEGIEKFCTQCGAPIEVPAPAKKSSASRWPKIVGIVGGVVVVVVIIALLIGGIGGTSSPEQTIRAFYRAAERLDASGQADLLVEEYRAMWMWEMTLEMSYDIVDSLSISNLTITVTSRTQDTAEAVVEWDYVCRLKDGSVYPKGHEVDHFDLVRVGSRWLISETDAFCG